MQCAIPAAPSLAPFLLPLLLFTVFPLASRPFQPKGAREITHSHSSTRHSTSFFCIKLPLSLQPSQQWEHAMQSTARLQSVPHSRTCGQLQLRPSTRDGETRPVVLRMRSRFSKQNLLFLWVDSCAKLADKCLRCCIRHAMLCWLLMHQPLNLNL